MTQGPGIVKKTLAETQYIVLVVVVVGGGRIQGDECNTFV